MFDLFQFTTFSAGWQGRSGGVRFVCCMKITSLLIIIGIAHNKAGIKRDLVVDFVWPTRLCSNYSDSIDNIIQ